MLQLHWSVRAGIPRRLLASIAALVIVVPMLVLSPAPASAQEDPVRILVLSKNPGHPAASVAAANTVRDLAADIAGDEDVHVEVDETNSTSQFSNASFLEQYDAIVFNYTSGQVFDNQAQRDGFQAYIQDGGGFVGLHFTGWAAGGGTLLDTWPWYHDLVGAKAINHPENPAVFNADVVVPDTEHPLVEGLPERHRRADEWYDWVVNPANDVKILVEVDTATYASGQSRNGTLHPLTWCQEYDGGRSWFTSMGHDGGMWSESYMRTMLRHGLEYSSGIVDADCSPRAKDEVGEWSEVIPWSLMPINAALTAEGKVQTFGSVIPQTTVANPDDWSGNPAIHQGGQFEIDIWEPSQDRTEETRFDGVVPNTTYTDLFCAIQVNDPNRRTMLTMGGDDGLGGNAPNEAAIGVTSWSERAGLQNEAPMKYPRWYPTSTVMPNGDIVVQGGSLFGGPGGPGVTTPELYTPDEGSGWKSLEGATSSTAYSANQNRWWYPRAFVSPEGDLYNITGTIHYSLDPYGNDGEGELTVHGQLPTNIASQGDLGNPVGATSTATMYAPGKIMQVGGGHWQNGGGPDGARGGFTVDLTTEGGSADPVFETIEPMRHPRHWADSTVLPDGKVIVTGGSRVNTALGGIATTPEIWDPETGQWESDLAVAQRHRLYHSTALLLPDGRVMTGGGGAPGPHNYANVEFYSPPYLFDGDELAERPEITDAPAEIGYDGAFDVSVSEEVDRVTLVRSGSVTHSFNNDQRFQELDFVTTGDGQITVNAPDNANDAPPGTYLLFVFNEDGTPSVAELVQLDPEVENDHRTPILVDQFEYPRIPTTWASGTYPSNVEVEPGNARMSPWVVDSTVRLVRGLQSGLGGLGKTALVDRFARLRALRGAYVLSAKGFAPEQHLPFGIAAQWIKGVESRVLGALDEPWRSILSNAFPGILASAVVPAPEVELTGEFRILEAFRYVLLSLASQRTLTIILDDAGAADSASIGMLHYVFRRVPDIRLLFVATVRSPTLDAHTLSHWPSLHHVRLGPLSLRETEALVARLPAQTSEKLSGSHMAALCAANFSSQPTSECSRSWASASGSNVTPSGERSTSMPPSCTTATPATSRSSIPFSEGKALAPPSENESGSKPRRSVKRQCSSLVEGIGSSR
jgi:large repetitive protein